LIPGPVVEGQIAVRVRNDQFSNDPFADLFGAGAGMMAGTKPIRVEGEPIVLNVRASTGRSGDGPGCPRRRHADRGVASRIRINCTSATR
jgi:hypothetical protein